MNIYLNIDEVPLIKDKKIAQYADDFLEAILKKYPDSTYFLAAKGESDARDILRPFLKPETAFLLDKIKPSKWNELKTEAIDFETDFLWFDNDLWPDELKILEKNEALERFIMVNPNKDPDILQKLAQVVNDGQEL